jgi:hypothetical protein
MHMGKVGGIVIAIIIAVIAVSMQFSNKSELADDTRLQVTSLLQGLPDYSEAGPYYEGLATKYHETTFEDFHKMGSRRTSSSFDTMGYIKELLEAMAKDADGNGQSERAGYLRELKDGVYIEVDAG